MKRTFTRILAGCTAAVLLAAGLAGCGGAQTPGAAAPSAAAPAVFEPRLDTSASVSLEVSGFFGNFEALDQVINDFNAYYPNVTVSYEQNNGNQLVDYLKNNPQTDIFMTDDTNLRYPDWTESYVRDTCADLTAAGVDTSAAQDDLLTACTFDGALLRLPIGQNVSGLAVNKTLLEKEGLAVPATWQEFLDVCAALKEKGYTPIQGPEGSIYTNLVFAMGMDTIADADTLAALNAGDAAAAEKLQPVFERIRTLLDNGYIDPAVNADYPADNYDGAILKFFEGDVPFWACSIEKVSGMKKRESKSEAFTASPFEYEFMHAPLGDDGVYEFVEPWVGFSVNKNSTDYDYAVEFVRFMALNDQLNTLATVKGVPSITKTADDARYTPLDSAPKVQQRFVNDGTVLNHMKDYFQQNATKVGWGELTPEEAAADYVARCAQTAAEMAAK